MATSQIIFWIPILKLIYHHFPKAEIVTVSNAGHWLHAENPSEFFEKSVRFLNE